MSATDYGRKKIVDHVTSVAPWSPPALYLALLTADPTEAGLLTSEVSGGAYARQPLSGVMGAADSSGVSVNTTGINYGPATTDWGTVTFFGIMDSATPGAGNMIVPGVPATPRTITVGQPLQIPAGRLRLQQA
jgi:hypothetical protein